MKFIARDYQRAGMAFIDHRKRGALHIDMGLGKTAVVATACLDLIDCFDSRGTMVFAPLQVATIAWPEEFQKWDHLRRAKMIVVRGTEEERKRMLRTPAHFHVLNYDLMPWWVEWVAGECKAKRPLLQDILVLDESSRLRSHDSNRFKDLKPLCDSRLFPRIIEMTGTPAPEDYANLWSQYRLLDGGVALEKFVTHFQRKYFIQNPYNRFDIRLAPGAAKAIEARIAPLTFTARAEDYLDLPPIIQSDHLLDLPKKSQHIYDDFQTDMIATLSDTEVAAPSAAMVSEKCRQVCSGAVYDELGEAQRLHEIKFDALDEIRDYASDNLMVAFWYRHELDTIKRRYPTAAVLGPGVCAHEATRISREWNAKKIPLLFVHPGSVGHGLNLQHGGHTLIWMTMPWSNELVQQMNGRLHRSGQTSPVSVIRMLCRRTIEVKIDRIIGEKQSQQAGLRAALAIQQSAIV